MEYAVEANLQKMSLLLRVGEAADFLHVHANTLRRWNDAGLLTSYRIYCRGDRRFQREDLIQFLNDHSGYKE
jgi:excisionase family DNA binding protein